MRITYQYYYKNIKDYESEIAHKNLSKLLFSPMENNTRKKARSVSPHLLGISQFGRLQKNVVRLKADLR